MQMSLKRIAALVTVTLLTAAVLLTGCSATPSPTVASTVAPTAAPLSGKLSLSGSTSSQPLVQKLADAFMKANPGVTINVQGGGSSVGVADAQSGLSDIGNVSRALTDAEKAALTETTICIDGIDAIVNTANGVSDLTAQQITDIYTGKVTNWKDVGGADMPIIVVQREASSGTRDAFQGFFKLVDANKNVLVVKTALECNSTGAVITTVAGKPGAIGYASMGSVDNTVKALKIGGVEPTLANIMSKTYTYQRPFVMATKGAPAGVAKAFIDWIFGADGQAIVSQGYIVVPQQ
jgi:phosphate transport system substrate-binding protein